MREVVNGILIGYDCAVCGKHYSCYYSESELMEEAKKKWGNVGIPVENWSPICPICVKEGNFIVLGQ